MTWKLGAYRVDDKPFAAGATAEVFGARKGRTGERVAVKVLPLRTFRDRAEAEAEIATIDHPRLLAARDRVVDERRGVVGLIMDLANEGDLRTALRSANAPSPIEMVQIADDVLAALDALHAVGLVHRDIKPENIMLDRVDGELRGRLGDMGIARQIDRTRSTGSVLGTDLYIAPEVHDGALPSPAADLWALGYVLYEGLFGAPPHADAATTYQAIGRLRTEGPDRPPDVPDSIWNVVSALLSPSPDQRPAGARQARVLLDSARSAAEAASTLGRNGDSPTAAVRRPSARRRSTAMTFGTVERPRPSYERRPNVTRAASAAVAVLLVVSGVAWTGGRGQGWFSDDATDAGAVRSVTPMSSALGAVVPTQYRWRLRNGTLTGRLDVLNPSSAATPAASIPELFPKSAVRRGALALVGHYGPTETQQDGSVLARFAVPSLEPRAHHVVAFRVSIPKAADDRSALARLLRERQAAISRHDLALSEAPTVAQLVIDVATPSLTVGDRSAVQVHGRTPKGGAAPAGLLQGVRLEVIGSGGILRVEGLSIVAVSPGTVVVRAVLRDLHADVPVAVAAAPEKPRPTVTRQRRQPATVTTIIEEEAPPPPPKDVVV